VFTVEMDGVRISCSSPRCIQSLLQRGWTLADRSQSDDLMAQLAAREAATASEPETLHPWEPDPEAAGDGFNPAGLASEDDAVGAAAVARFAPV